MNWDLTFIIGKAIQHTKLGITLVDVTQQLYGTSTYVFRKKKRKKNLILSPSKMVRKSLYLGIYIHF